MLRNYLNLFFLLILGSLFSLVGFFTVQKMENQQARYEFEEAAQERIWVVQHAIRNTLEVLHALDAFYTTLVEIKREQFNTFVSPLLAYHPDILALNWVPHVPHVQRADYEAAARKYYPNFRFTVRHPQKQMVTAPKAEEYFPVYYQVSNVKNEFLLGFNLASEIPSRIALEKARDTGTWQATGPMKLMINETTQQSAILVIYPIYHQQVSLETPAQRQEHLRGFITGIFLVNQIVNKALEHFSAYEQNINILIQDESAPTTERLLYAHLVDAVDQKILLDPMVNGLRVKHSFEIAGRSWSILCFPASNYPVGEKNWLSVGTLLSGFLFTVLIIFYVYNSIKYTNILRTEILERRSVEAALKRAEENLTKYNQTLEQQVLKRTQQLVNNNRLLQQEIQERQQAEASLRESEEYWRTLIQEARIGLLLARVDGTPVELNPAFANIVGYSVKEFLEKNLTLFDISPKFYSEIEKKEMRNIENYFKSKNYNFSGTFKIARYEDNIWRFGPYHKELIHKDGHPVPIRASGMILERKGEHFIWANIEDITDQKQAEEALRKSQERTSRIFELPLVGITIASPSKQLLEVNNKLCEIFGYSREELFQKSWAEITYPDDLNFNINYFEQLLAGKLDSYSMEKRYIRKDGQIIYTTLSVSCIRSAEGAVEYVVGFVQDITDKKQAEQALYQSQKKIQRLFELPLVGMAITSPSKGWIDANDKLCEIFGYASREELFQKTWSELTHPDDLAANLKLFDQVLANEIDGYTLDNRLIRKDGSVIYGSISVRCQRMPSGAVDYLVAIIQDITERKQAEDILKEYNNKLEHDVSKRTQELANKNVLLKVAHERFKTVLDSLNSAVFVIDMKKCNILFTNELAQKFFESHLLEKTCSASSQEKRVTTFFDTQICLATDPLKSTDFCFFATNGQLITANDQLTKVHTWEYEHPKLKRWFYVQYQTIPWDDGQLVRLLVATEITARKQAELALSESEKRFRQMADSAPVMIWVSGIDKKCFYFNKGWLEFTGRTTKQELDNGWTQGVHPEDYQYCLDTYFKAFEARQSFHMEYRLRRHDGQYRWVLDSGVPRYADNDEFAGYIGSAIDIDEQKRVQEALQKSEGRLKAIFDNVMVGIVLANAAGLFIHCNTKWLEMTGYTYDEITQLTYLDITHPDDIELSRKHYEPLIKGTVHCYHIEKRFLRKNGCFFWADVSVTLITNKNNKFETVIGVIVDITERKQTEELLLQSEARLIEAQRIAHIGHWERNFITRKVQWSREVFRILGLPEKTKITPKIFANTIYPDDRHYVPRAMRQSIYHDEPYHSELRIVLPHGAIRHVQAIGKVIRNTRGKPLSLRGTVQDITERKQIEETLRESEAYWRTLIEEALIGLLLVDMRGRIIEANPAYATITGYTLDELHQLTIWDIMPKNLQFKSELFDLLKTKGRFGPLEQQYINKKGDMIPIRVSGVSVKRKGKYFVWCNVENITEQKQSEAQLQAAYSQLQQFKTTLDLTLDGVFIADANSFKFFYVNQGAMNHLGYTQEELLQMTQEDLVPISMRDCVYEAITPLAKGEELAKTFECLYQHKNGSLIPVEVSIQRISIPGQMTRFVGISRDISERKQTEQTLQQAKEAAEAANRAKSSFLANMSHELRTPLNGILGYAQIFKNDPTLSVEHKKGIDIIERSGNYLLTLINDILDLSKIEAGKIELSPTEFNFQSFIQSITDIFSLRAKQKGINFIYQALTNLPLEICADEKRLRQILINLLGNAVKFVKAGEVRLTVGYEPNNKDQIRFQVEDTGIGIAAEELDKIFLPFQQAGDNDYRSQGTGLGLSITKKLVEMMGGELQVNSVLQQGSTFWTILNLPEVRKPAPSKPVEKGIIIGYQRIEQKTTPIPHLPFKILVIDDHFENRLVLVKILTPLGFEVMQANDGLDGLEKVQTLQPDLVLLDLMMPVMSGLEFISQVRQISALAKIIVIAVSASVFSHHRHESLAAGCNDFLPKPIRIEELLKCLQKYLPLEWVYKSKERAEELNHEIGESNDDLEPTDISASLRVLSKKQAFILFDLGMKGDIMGIIEYAKKLEQDNQQLAAVARKICKLAQEFEEEQICDLVEPYLEKNK